MKRIAYFVVAALVALVVLVWLAGFIRGYLDARSGATHPPTQDSALVAYGVADRDNPGVQNPSRLQLLASNVPCDTYAGP